MRSGDGNGQTRKTGTTANVGEPTLHSSEFVQSEQALTEVKFDDFTWISHARQRDLSIPLQKQVDVDAYVLAHFGAGIDSVGLQSLFDLVRRQCHCNTIY